MTDERPVADIIRDLRAQIRPSRPVMSPLLYEAADKLESLLADLVDAENARDRYRAERDVLIGSLSEADEGEFRMLHQTREQAVDDVGKERYSQLLTAFAEQRGPATGGPVTTGPVFSEDGCVKPSNLGDRPCGFSYISFLGTLTCSRYAHTDSWHWDSLGEFGWHDPEVQ